MKPKSSAPAIPKLNPKWIKQTKIEFLEFLRATHFPEVRRNGARGSTFEYPEWLIMLIEVLSVKCKVKTYQGIQRLTVQYWEWLTPRGDDGLITATTTITLTVSKPRFNVTATPSNLTVGAGQPMTTVFKLDVQALNGWTTPITLTIDPSAMPALGTLGLRTDATPGALNHTLVVTPSNTAYLVVVTAADTPRGLYTFSIDAQGGGRQQTLEVTLKIGESKIYLPLVMRDWVAQPKFRLYLPLIVRSAPQAALAWHQ